MQLSQIRFHGWIMLLFIGSMLISGCGRKREAEDRPVTITFMHEANPIRKEQIALFEKKHPHIRVRMSMLPAADRGEKVLTSIAGGVPPDVFFIMDMRLMDFVLRDALKPLDDFIARDAEFTLEDYFPMALEGYRFEGRQYAIPGNMSTSVLFYNKAMFDEAGLAYPTPDWNWDDLLAAAKKLTRRDEAGRTKQFGLLVNTSCVFDALTFIHQSGGRFFNEDGTRVILNSPETREALLFLRALSEKYHVAPRGGDFEATSGIDLFSMGRAAMLANISGRWRTITLRRSAVAEDFRIAELFGGKRKANLFLTMGWAIPRTARHPEEAWELIRFLTQKDGLDIVIDSGDGVPPLISLANSERFLFDPEHPNENNQVFLDSLNDAFRFPVSRYIPTAKARSIFQRELDKFILGRQGIDQTLKDIESSINNIIRENMDR